MMRPCARATSILYFGADPAAKTKAASNATAAALAELLPRADFSPVRPSDVD
jgi:hypothetical protein